MKPCALGYAIDEAHLIEPHRLAGAVVDDILVDLTTRRREHRRRLTLKEIATALNFEVLLVCVAAGNVASGVELSEEDRERLYLAKKHIEFILAEAAR